MAGESGAADGRLEQRAEDVEGEHVERQVDEPGVQEGGGDDPVRLPAGDRGPEEAAVAVHRASTLKRPRAAADELEQVRRDAEPDQGVGHRGVGPPGRPAGLAHLGLLAGALGTSHPDRGRGHAIGADRPAAGGAGDLGLAARVSVAVGHATRDDIGAPPPYRGACTVPSARLAIVLPTRLSPGGSMSTSSPARLYCMLVGAVLVIAGIIGFFYSASFDGVSG